MASGFEDPYLTCPLDEVHRIRKSRMQCHLTKCLKNHKLMDKIKCPFNPLHIIYPNDMPHHMTICESNASVAVQRYHRNDQKCFSGIISEKEAMAQLEAAFGSFSNEVEYKHTIDTPAYDPIQANIDNPLFRSLNCESKSKRKEFRLKERRRIAAIEAEKGKKQVEPTKEDRPMRELNPIRSQSVLATYQTDEEGLHQQDHTTIYNYQPPQGIMYENEEKEQEVLSNGHDEIFNETEDKAVEENPSSLVDNFDELAIEDDFDDIAKKLEFLSQKENEIQRERRELMFKLSERATQTKIASQTFLEKTYNELTSNNPFKINSNDSINNKPIHSLPSEESIPAVENKIAMKPAYSGVVAKKPSTPIFELSSHYQSSAWNVVGKTKLEASSSSTAPKNTTSKSVKAPVAQILSNEENLGATSSSEWITVSRSKKVSAFLDFSTRKTKAKSREPSPVRDTFWRKATDSKEIMPTSESQVTSLDVKTNSRETSPVREVTSWRKVDASKERSSTSESVHWNVAPKETSLLLKLTPWSNVNSRETSPTREATPWNKVATLKETSPTSESTPWTVMIRSKKVSSSQQCTQWKLAPESTKTSTVKPLSPTNITASIKTLECPQLISSEKATKSNETSPASVSSLIDTKPKSRPVLRDSSKNPTLISTSVTSTTVSSTYSTMAKITKDKLSEHSVTSLKDNVSSNEFLPIPRRSKTATTLFSSQVLRPVAPVAGRGIIHHAFDEIERQKNNDIISHRLRSGSTSSFRTTFDQIDIEGVYGYEEAI